MMIFCLMILNRAEPFSNLFFIDGLLRFVDHEKVLNKVLELYIYKITLLKTHSVLIDLL